LGALGTSAARRSPTISGAVAAGLARKIGPRLYTGNVTDEPETIVRRNLWPAVSRPAPGTVIGYRTAMEMAPATDGTVFLTEPPRVVESFQDQHQAAPVRGAARVTVP